jgi:hypothetical protein
LDGKWRNFWTLCGGVIRACRIVVYAYSVYLAK